MPVSERQTLAPDAVQEGVLRCKLLFQFCPGIDQQVGSAIEIKIRQEGKNPSYHVRFSGMPHDNQHIHIACSGCIATRKRAKNADIFHIALPTDLRRNSA
jgi:hypothetical protein